MKTIRDEIAIEAMKARLAEFMKTRCSATEIDGKIIQFCVMNYKIADAMITARSHDHSKK